MLFRYLGIGLGLLGSSVILTPIVASLMKNSGVVSMKLDDRVYVAAGLGLVLALVGLGLWAVSEFASSDS